MADIEARAIARLRGARRADDQHLHQLPDHPAARARRAPGHRRHRRRHLLQQRDGRAQQLRGRPLGAGRGPHRPHAALRLSPRRSTAPAPCMFEVAHQPSATSPTGARSAASSAGPPTATGRCRSSPASRQVAQLRRAQALRRGAGELRLGGAVPHAGRHARGADALSDAFARPRRSRRRPHRQGRLRRLLRAATRRRATRSTWWCSPRRSSR